MTRITSWLWIGILLLISPALAQRPTDERRLLRIESRVYGWYGVVEPAFDKTIGRRELFKINAADNFLKGLDGRLVVLQGRFAEGELHLGQLAPPPISVPEGSHRQRFSLDPSKSVPGTLLSSDGYLLQGDHPALASATVADLVVAPLSGQELQIVEVLSATNSTTASTAPARAVSPSPIHSSQGLVGALLELEMSQSFLDTLVDLGREQAGLRAEFKGVNLEASQLRVILPDAVSTSGTAWRLEGTVELGYLGTGSLAESSFVISALPSISNNVLRLEPNWDEIKLEGQLPFGFRLDAAMLGQLKAYLPKQVPILNLDWVSTYLRNQGLLETEEQVVWFLGDGGQGVLRLGLAPVGRTVTFSSTPRPLAPGQVRLQLAAPVADRLVRRGVQGFLNPDTPFVPNPPITVGKVLFVAIKVEQVFLRSLQSGYSNGVFRFQDLVVDVAWKAGPLSGVEPLLSTSGYIYPRLSMGSDGVRYWDWDTKIERLIVRSDKIPGNKETLAAELVPRLEKELGSELAQKQKVPARLQLSQIVPNSSSTASLELTELRPLDAYLELEGRIVR